MAYVVQLRRGVKETSADGTVTRDDWATYTRDEPEKSIPRAGELVLEYDNGVPRLKIGNGKDPFSALPYMSVDSFLLPTPASVTLSPNEWYPVLDEHGEPIANRFYQSVTVNNAAVTPNSKIDLQPTPEQLAIFHRKELTFTAVNSGGNVRVCIVGQKPTQTYKIQATITEVARNE